MKRFLPFFLLSLCCNIFINAQTPADYMRAGNEKGKNKDYAGSILEYTKAIEVDAKYVMAYLNRGVAKGFLNDLAGAIKDYDQVILLKNDAFQAYFVRGVAKQRLKDFKGALSDYDKVVELNDGYKDIYFNRGIVKAELNDYKGAIDDYSQAIKLAPGDQEAYYNRGIAKKQDYNFAGALEDYDKAIQINPNYWEAFNNRANLKTALSDYQGAINDFDKVLELNAGYADAVTGREAARLKLKHNTTPDPVKTDPQQTFITQLNDIQFSKFKNIKGSFVIENTMGEDCYICTKPLLGFTTMIVQKKGSDKMVVQAVAKSGEPLPPKLDGVVDQLTRMATILGNIKKDSQTDAALRSKVASMPKIKRIIVFAEEDGKRSIMFFVNHDDNYMVTITNDH